MISRHRLRSETPADAAPRFALAPQERDALAAAYVYCNAAGALNANGKLSTWARGAFGTRLEPAVDLLSALARGQAEAAACIVEATPRMNAAPAARGHVATLRAISARGARNKRRASWPT